MESSTPNTSPAGSGSPILVPEESNWTIKISWIFSVLLLVILCSIGIYLNLPYQDRQTPAFNSNLPEDLGSSLQQGTLLFEQGQLDTAETLYNRLIQDFPSYPHGYNNLAALHALKGDLDQARILLEQAMATDQGYAAIYNNLGTIYAELARDSYGKALQLDPVDLRTQLQILDPQGIAQLESAETTPIVTSNEPKDISAVAQETVSLPVVPPVKEAAPEPEPVIIEQPEPQLTVASVETISEEPALPVIPVLETPANFIKSWAAAWSAQDADTYFSFYAEEYRHNNYKTRRSWEKKRRSRIIQPAFIEITLEDIKILSTSADRAEIEIVQGYRNDRFQDRTRKRFDLKRSKNSWVITRERVLGSVR